MAIVTKLADILRAVKDIGYGYDFLPNWDMISYHISENVFWYYIISNIPLFDIISDMIWKRYEKIYIFNTTGNDVERELSICNSSNEVWFSAIGGHRLVSG